MSFYSQNSCHGNYLIFESACEQCQLPRYQGKFGHVTLTTMWSAIPSIAVTYKLGTIKKWNSKLPNKDINYTTSGSHS